MKNVSIKHQKILPLSRVEGHGGIIIEIEDKKVKEFKLNIYEGPRLIEEIVKGKSPSDVLNIVPRICGICSFSHRYAAILGIERALNINPNIKTECLRELMLLGEILQSHALHLYLLSLPDFLGYASAIEMADNYGEEIRIGLTLKSFGYRIMELLGGRMIHGENPIIGGFGVFPSAIELMEIKETAGRLIPYAERTIELFSSFDYPNYADRDTLFIALNPADGEYGFVGGSIITSDGKEVSIENCKEILQEYVVPHSYAKRCKYNNASFTVGAMARINLLGGRLKGNAYKYFKNLYSKARVRSAFFNLIAQAIEILYCLETIQELIDKIIELELPKPNKILRKTGTGTGAVEAPRGTLYHHYEIKNGIVVGCNIITPTAQNLDDIEKTLTIATNKLLSIDMADNLEDKLAMLVRAYDPCISCSVHSLKINPTIYKDKKVRLGRGC